MQRLAHGTDVITVLIAVVFLVSATPLSAQRTELGVVGGFQLNMHHASFTQLGDFASCCPQFSGGTGAGFYVGGFLTLPINNQWRMMSRLTYSSESGTMINDEGSFVADLRDSAQIVPAVFRHELTASLSTLQFEQFVGFRPVGQFDLLVGGTIGMVMSKSFVQTETLIEPSDFGNYLGSGRTWVNHNAEIPQATSIRATVAMGARYVFPLNTKETFFIAPEVFYHIPVTDVSSEATWTISGLRIGVELGLMFVPEPETPPAAQTPLAPPTTAITMVPTPEPPTIKLIASSPDDSTWRHTSGILVEETQVVDFIPLLNHVYFAEGSSTIPDRYVIDDKEVLDPTNLRGSIRFVLPNLAKRLVDDPSATVTVLGHTSNTPGDRGVKLAQARAESVARVLESLGVKRSRIRTKTRTLPSMPTRASAQEDQAEAAEENRRVEIIPSDQTMLDPLALASRLSTVTPSSIAVSANVKAEGGVESYSITSPAGRSTSPINIQTSSLDTSKRLLMITGRIQDSTGAIGTDTLRIQQTRMTVEKKRSNRQKDTEIERYSLILFGFNDASVTSDHRRQLSRIRERINQGATVRIIGMTDSMGSSAYNRELSRKRAVRVAEALGLDESAVEAVGDTQSRFNNALPEGRAYNRTVIIEVRMPVN